MMINYYQTLLTEKKRLTADVWLFRFKLINPPEISFKAGQYLILRINNQSRLYSIFSPSYIKDYVDFMVKIIPEGLASIYLNNLQPGEQVKFEGPAGVFQLKENYKDKIFLVTSTGLAPVWSIISSYFQTQPTKPPRFFLFWGLRYFNEVFYLDRIKQLAINNQLFKFLICLSQDTNFNKIPEPDRQYFRIGRVNIVLENFIKKLNQPSNPQLANSLTNQPLFNSFDYYLCGSRQVVESLNQFLLDKGIAKENIFFEKF